MKYKAGDYLASEGSVLLKIIVSMHGDCEVYATMNIKDPIHIRWLTLAQLDHEGLRPVTYNPHEFYEAKVGNYVACAPNEYKRVLAICDTAILLSMVPDKDARAIAHMLSSFSGFDGQPVPESVIKDIKHHASQKYALNTVDNWYDRDIMALMNWKLIKEE